ELRELVADRGLPFRNDSSNLDVPIPRNRVRLELLPYLEREFSPNISAILACEASIAREDEDRLQKEAIDLARGIVLRVTTPAGTDLVRVEVDAAGLAALHPALAARVARVALSTMAERRFVGADHVERFIRFAREARPGSALSLPGQQAVHRGDRVVLGPEPGRARAVSANGFRFPLSIPGEVAVSQAEAAGLAISAEPLDPAV